MLLTSRETRRWVIPKGWPMPGRKPCQVAKQEAFEEAGLIGKLVSKEPVGSYHYTKILPSNQQLLIEVLVFLLQVEYQLEDWPEKSQRETRWFEPERQRPSWMKAVLAKSSDWHSILAERFGRRRP
jgi:8-oxo-dGTP pyrophosphatase MutT (NUDIX family)